MIISGLRAILNNEIKKRGYLSMDDVERICKECRYKTSNGERRLRPSESPDVEGLNKNGTVAKNNEPIVGYRRKRAEQKLFEMEETKRGPDVIF